MLKIGITGVNGFVGGALFEYLKGKGYDVQGFTRANWNIESGPISFDPGIDVLIHSAGKVDDWALYKDCYKGNVTGTENVLKSFPSIKKIIYVSTFSVYDHKVKDYFITETTPTGNYMNGYGRSKSEAEKLIMKDDGLSQKVIIRPHIIYGKGDKKILPRLLKSVRLGIFPILGNGKNTLSITHIDNLCNAIELAVTSDLPEKVNIFNIADKESITLDELINFIKDKFKVKAKNFHINKFFGYFIGYILWALYRVLGIKTPPTITPFIVMQMTSNHKVSIEKAEKILKYSPTKSYLDIE